MAKMMRHNVRVEVKTKISSKLGCHGSGLIPIHGGKGCLLHCVEDFVVGATYMCTKKDGFCLLIHP